MNYDFGFEFMPVMSGASDKPLLGSTIGEFFNYAVKHYSDREAIVSIHQQVSLLTGNSRNGWIS